MIHALNTFLYTINSVLWFAYTEKPVIAVMWLIVAVGSAVAAYRGHDSYRSS